MRTTLTAILFLFVCEALAEKNFSPSSWPEGVLQAYHDQMMSEPGLAENL